MSAAALYRSSVLLACVRKRLGRADGQRPSIAWRAMTLPLFDDQLSRAPRQVTLVRLAGEIARSLVGIGRIAVEGEVYRPTTTKGGWVFFTLRDRAAQIEVLVPASKARGTRIAAGERVCVVGKLQWTNERGQLQLAAEEVTPVGAGAIA